jgi:HlyD family type I secretion membrane fusion protein
MAQPNSKATEQVQDAAPGPRAPGGAGGPPQSPLPLPYPRQSHRIIQGASRSFVILTAIAVIGLITWSARTEIDRVVRGYGKIVPQSQIQTVQHFEGGIVTEILVREGDSVTQGMPLLKIDNSFSRSELAQAEIDMKAKQARIIRLGAEIDDSEDLVFPQDLVDMIPKIIGREREVFDSRRVTLKAQVGILEDQYKQKSLDLSEAKSRWANTIRERELVNQRVINLRKLNSVGAFSTNDLLDNERSLQQIEQRLSDLVHEIPRDEAMMSEIERRIAEAKSRFRSDAEKERSDTELQIAKLEETISALKDRSARSDVLAPMDGIVNKLHVTTVGGVVKSGEPLVEIVPGDAAVAIEARLQPNDRADVWPGQKAVIKVSAYDYSIYGGLQGKVVDISADALQDEKGQPYFRVRLEASQRNFGEGKPITPGMLAEVDILTGRRTILESLLRPVKQVQSNALRP